MQKKQRQNTISRLERLTYLFSILTKALETSIYHYGVAPLSHAHLADIVCIELCKELKGSSEVLSRLHATADGQMLHHLEKYIMNNPHLQHLQEILEAPDSVDKLIKGITAIQPAKPLAPETEDERLNRLLDEGLKKIQEAKDKAKKPRRKLK